MRMETHATIQALATIGPDSRVVVAAFMEILENDRGLAGRVVNAFATMGPEATEAVRVYIDEVFNQVAKGDDFVYLKGTGGATYFVPVKAESKLRSLGGLATPFLRAGLNDEREPVRVISAYVLVNQGETSSEVVNVLTMALDKPWYRCGALAKLKKIGPSDREALPALRSQAVNVTDDSRGKTKRDESIHAVETDLIESPADSKPNGGR